MFTASNRTLDNILPGMCGPDGELGGEGEDGCERWVSVLGLEPGPVPVPGML